MSNSTGTESKSEKGTKELCYRGRHIFMGTQITHPINTSYLYILSIHTPYLYIPPYLCTLSIHPMLSIHPRNTVQPTFTIQSNTV